MSLNQLVPRLKKIEDAIAALASRAADVPADQRAQFELVCRELYAALNEVAALLHDLAPDQLTGASTDPMREQIRANRERMQVLSRQLLQVQEAERRHLARELHDEFGQTLTALKFMLDLSMRLPPEQVQLQLREIKAVVSELMEREEELSLDLRPSHLDDLGLLPTLFWHFQRYTARTKVQVNFKHAGLEGVRFEPNLETAAYRIVQEALTNVARHAGVEEVMVRLNATAEELGLEVRDHGVGFDAESALATGTCVGLSGMHERAVLLGGELAVTSARGAGTLIQARLPLQERLERPRTEREL